MKHRIPTLAVALLILTALHPAHAQLVPAVNPAGAPARHSAGIAFIVGQPLGDFKQNVRNGFGLDGMGTLGLDSRGIFSLRAQLGLLQYSRKTETFWVQGGFGLFELESETKSGVFTLGVGPQLMAPTGNARPYIAGTIGLARFSTTTAINVPADQSNSGTTEQIADETISSDNLLSLTGAAGVAFKLSIFGNSGVMADLGVRYVHNGLAKYVSSDGVQYSGTGEPTITPTTSEADFLTYRLGVVIPIR
jgi:opacity protein-like surface antigen